MQVILFFRIMERHHNTSRNIQENKGNDNMKNMNVADLAKTPMYNRQSDLPDPNIVHHYDNFYHTTKSLLVLFQIMGVMPIERQIGRTTYR